MEGVDAECPCPSTGSCDCSGDPSRHTISLCVSPTTGGQFQLDVPRTDSIQSLKKLISKRLKVPKERICLLYRERQLREGTVEENHLVQGSRLTLLPSVETGLLAQRPEQSVMQALESLNDSQVNDFLSGKAPLNLTMRLGDHMMLIQLQLSTVAPAGTSSPVAPSPAGPTPPSPVTPSPAGPTPPSPVATSPAGPSPPSPVVPSPAGPTSPAAAPAPAPPPVPTPHPPAAAPPPPPPAPSQPSPSPPRHHAARPPCDCTSATSQQGWRGCECGLDTRALAEASRNLTQTLKQLSSEVLTSKSDTSLHEGGGGGRRQGAIIESMQHHGKGVYSGTFSGTLNPALQDRFGRPKRDISTIIHILNDLLCATPQYRAASSSSAHGGTSSRGVEGSQSASSGQDTSSRHHALPSGERRTDAGCGSVTGEESQENRATRGKMERLRLVLGQRRERRRAMRGRPYPPATAPAPSPPASTDSVTA